MKNENKKIIIACIITAVCVSGIWSIFYTKQSVESGRLCNQLRERISNAEDINRGLTVTVEQCHSICKELGSSVDRSINTARQAVELIEEIREQVQALEMVACGFNWDNYYNYWDSVLEVDSLIEVEE